MELPRASVPCRLVGLNRRLCDLYYIVLAPDVRVREALDWGLGAGL